MNGDRGHFTLEALIALALLGLVMATAQIMTAASLGRAARAKVAFDEALRLEQAQLCLPRVGLSGDVPQLCKDGHLPSPPARFGLLRTYSLAMPRSGTADTAVLYRLEFDE